MMSAAGVQHAVGQVEAVAAEASPVYMVAFGTGSDFSDCIEAGVMQCQRQVDSNSQLTST
jgi:hypothetical protein